MAKAILPKVNFKTVDLAQYGGEGLLRIKGVTTEITANITSGLQALAQADGYTIADIERDERTFNARYNVPMILLTIKECVSIEDDEGFRPLTMDEINDLPADLAAELYSIIGELNQFPLVQKGGEESKKEQLKPTSVE